MESRIPPGLVRCEVCGGFNGVTLEKYLAPGPRLIDDTGPPYDPESRVSSTCRCHGPLCRAYGVNRISLPTSNFYDEKSNRIIHVPYFMYMRLCDTCSPVRQAENVRMTQASLTPDDKAVHAPWESRPGDASLRDIASFTLDSKRSVSITALVIMPTYLTLLAGLPDPDFDAELILQARKRAHDLWGIRPTHVIAPTYAYDTDAGRSHLRLPPVTFYAWLESAALPGSAKPRSQLIVIWFGRHDVYVDLLQTVKDSLQSLSWEELAGGTDTPRLIAEALQRDAGRLVRRPPWPNALAAVQQSIPARPVQAKTTGFDRFIGWMKQRWPFR